MKRVSVLVNAASTVSDGLLTFADPELESSNAFNTASLIGSQDEEPTPPVDDGDVPDSTVLGNDPFQ